MDAPDLPAFKLRLGVPDKATYLQRTSYARWNSALQACGGIAVRAEGLREWNCPMAWSIHTTSSRSGQTGAKAFSDAKLEMREGSAHPMRIGGDRNTSQKLAKGPLASNLPYRIQGPSPPTQGHGWYGRRVIGAHFHARSKECVGACPVEIIFLRAVQIFLHTRQSPNLPTRFPAFGVL